MAKYDPLNRYLRRQAATEVELPLSEVENLVTAPLLVGQRNLACLDPRAVLGVGVGRLSYPSRHRARAGDVARRPDRPGACGEPSGIACGRDAADIAFLTTRENCTMISQSITVQLA